MCVLSLLRRFVSSIIDKLFILIFFILCIHIFFDVTELGTYSAILELSSKSGIYDDHLYKIDILFTGIFLLINLLYYFIFEITLGASLGKIWMSGRFINSHYAQINVTNVISRNGIFLLLMLIPVIIRWLTGMTYYHAIAIYFLVNDMPTLFMRTHQSLIDYASSTYLVYDKNICKNFIGKGIAKLLNNSKYFPFTLGVNRLLFVIWIGISIWVEVSNWEISSHAIYNYCWGIVALFGIAVTYLLFLWIYNGFRKK